MVAEGIEYDEQWTALRDLGCDLGQGFLFARPMDAHSTLEYLRTAAASAAAHAPKRSKLQRRRHRRVRLLSPLRYRDFRLLWGGMCVSLIGDGVFMIAMAWQVYALSNAPTALAVVGIAMTVPTLAFLLLGGVLSDRFDRRRLMLAADITARLPSARSRLSRLAGALELWHIVALVGLCAGNAFFGPAFDAIVPESYRPASWPRRTRLTNSFGRSRCAWRVLSSAAC